MGAEVGGQVRGGGGGRGRVTVHVQEDHDAGEQQLELALDDGALILAGAPDVAPAESEVGGRVGTLHRRAGGSLGTAHKKRW